MWQRSHLENPLNLEVFNPDFRSEEILMGEGEAIARARLGKIVEGVHGHEQRVDPKAKM